jgi:hypothetical protein
MTTTMPRQKPNRSRQDFETPDDLIAAVKWLLKIAEFRVDLAADSTNAKSTAWLGPGVEEGVFGGWGSLALDSLTADWHFNEWCWLNPPFSNIAPWARKCSEYATSTYIAFLVPASVGSNWYRDYVEPFAAVRALTGRPSFDGVGPYPKDLILALYGPGFLPSFKTWNWKGEIRHA